LPVPGLFAPLRFFLNPYQSLRVLYDSFRNHFPYQHS
jgi:hypothetical protein